MSFIVCHSMGFAYAQGMISEIQKTGIKVGRYYIIAPENPSSGSITLSDFEEVWQYGSNEKSVSEGGHPIWKQDGVAPQIAVGNLDNNRIYIPITNPDIPTGFTNSHSVGNYKWIFNINSGKGYVKKRD